MNPDGGTPDEQLAALAAVAELLDRQAVDYWLFGGWAVDFWANRVTRPHDDVDLVVWQDDRLAIEAALGKSGWLPDVVGDDTIGGAFRRHGVLLELTFVTSDDSGRVFLPFRDGPAMWSAVPFGQYRRELSGVTSRVVPLANLRSDKAHLREDPDDGAKDRLDRDALLRLAE